jgi:hypothetical protein
MATKLTDNTIARLRRPRNFSAMSILIFIVELAKAAIFLVVKAGGSDSIQNTFLRIELKNYVLRIYRYCGGPGVTPP